MEKYYFPAPDISEADTLMYHDGLPLMVLATLGPDEHRLLCVALLNSPTQDPYLLVEITPEQEYRLLNNQVTLRALCLEGLPPNGLGVYYLQDFYSKVWEFNVLTEIAEDQLPGDVPLQPVA